MNTYTDAYGKKVVFQYGENQFDLPAKHVLVICQYKDNWLLTKHAIRGLEFPGGKVEIGETTADAAIREVYEETGAKIQSITLIGHYYVDETASPFVKTVYAADVCVLEHKDDYLETEGPFLIKKQKFSTIPKEKFSFLMTDGLISDLLNKLQTKK